MNTSQWGFSKGFDNTTPIGPCLVASATIKDPQQLSLKSILNNETVQDGNSADMIFSIARTISFLSSATTLLPGSIIMTGTPKGVGFIKKPPVYLKHGDEIKIFIEGIGTIVNSIVEEGNEQSKL